MRRAASDVTPDHPYRRDPFRPHTPRWAKIYLAFCCFVVLACFVVFVWLEVPF